MTALTPGGSWRGTPDPQEVGPYHVEGVIARGGMGSVYRAVDRRDGRRVALKMILAGRGATPEQRRRFDREVEAMRALDCEGVVRVLDAGAAGDVPWYAMELVDGPSLSRAAGELDLRARVEVMARVARAVGQAHARGYVHRDLKPDNVLLERRGRELVPRVTDFGLARQVGGESRLTADGAVLGTPHYMAPEQATGEVDQTSPATDVFSLGVMLYVALTGSPPFKGKTGEIVASQQALVAGRAAPPSPRQALPGVPADLDALCVRCLAGDPAARPGALDVAHALAAAVTARGDARTRRL